MLTDVSSTNFNNIKAIKNELLNLSLDYSNITPEIINNLVEKIKILNFYTFDNIACVALEHITFNTVIQPIIDLDIITQLAKSICTFPKDVHPDKSIRDVSSQANEELETLNLSNMLREDVFLKFNHYKNNFYLTEKDSLDKEEILLVEKISRDYRRNGLNIVDKKIKQKIHSLELKIPLLISQFESNCNESNSTVILSEEELTGMPDNWFTDDKFVAEGMYQVTLKDSDVYAILNYVANRDTRRKIYLAFESRLENENLSILKELLMLRAELANLKGYKTHADYAIETRMAKSTENVKKFLDDINEISTPLLQQNLNDLLLFAQDLEQDSEFSLQFYDMCYYMRLRKEKLFAIDHEVSKYFPVQQVISGTLEIYANLFGLYFAQNNNLNTWHEDVRCFDTFDRNTKEFLGCFYLDLYPREGKQDMAFVTPLLSGCDISCVSKLPDDRLINIVAMVCNFPENANLKFDDVITFFHEFGHIMHFMCSKTKLLQFHSNFSEIDFIETPSQMLENWCFEHSVLSRLSYHVDTHEPITQEITNKLKLKHELYAGYVNKRQLVYGYFDFLIHNMQVDEIQNLDLKTFYQEILSNIVQLPVLSEICTPAYFSHTVNRYDAGYYGYLMSLTYAKDMFVSVFKDNPFSPVAGNRYKSLVLEPGASLTGEEILFNFLGRQPTPDAFLQTFNLSDTQQNTTREEKTSENKNSFFSKADKETKAGKETNYQFNLEYYTLGC